VHGALVLTRVLTAERAYRAISWTTVVLIAGMIPVSVAIQHSGAADDLAACSSTSSATRARTCCSWGCSS